MIYACFIRNFSYSLKKSGLWGKYFLALVASPRCDRCGRAGRTMLAGKELHYHRKSSIITLQNIPPLRSTWLEEILEISLGPVGHVVHHVNLHASHYVHLCVHHSVYHHGGQINTHKYSNTLTPNIQYTP